MHLFYNILVLVIGGCSEEFGEVIHHIKSDLDASRVIESLTIKDIHYNDRTFCDFWNEIDHLFCKGGCIKRLSFVGGGFSTYIPESDSDYGEEEITGFDMLLREFLLPIFIPQSPKSWEIMQRIRREISKKQREKSTSYQIDELEQKIRDEVEVKFQQKLDENQRSILMTPIVHATNVNKQEQEDNDNDDDDNDDDCSDDSDNDNSDSAKNSEQRWFYQQLECNHNGSWCSCIEMVTFSSRYSVLFDNIDANIVKKDLTYQRLKNGFPKLKAFALYQVLHYGDSPVDLFFVIGVAIMNNLANQLESLHIRDSGEIIKQWNFVTNNYHNSNSKSKTDKDVAHCPMNIKHLCLHCNETKTAPDLHLWHNINCSMFPQLKHLIISNVMDHSNRYKILWSKNGDNSLSNLTSLIANGLETLHFKFDQLEMSDISLEYPTGDDENNKQTVQLLDVLFGMFNELENIDSKSKINRSHEYENEHDGDCKRNYKFDECSYSQETKKPMKKDFVLKLDFQIRSGKCDDKFERCMISLVNQVFVLYSSIMHYFENVMVGFKLSIYDPDEYHKAFEYFKKIKNQTIMKNDATRIVDVAVWEQEPYAKFALVFKNRNKGKTNESCDNCHMEPIYKYTCKYCKSKPWLQ